MRLVYIPTLEHNSFEQHYTSECRQGSQKMLRENYKTLISKLVEDDAFRGWVISSPLAKDNEFSRYDLTPEEAEMAEQIAWIRGYHLFDNVSADEWVYLLSGTILQKFKSGSAITRQGEQGENLYLILSGEVAILMRDSKNNWRHIATQGRGTIIGELAVLYEISRSATVIAHTEVWTLSMDRKTYMDLSIHVPSFAYNVKQIATARLSSMI